MTQLPPLLEAFFTERLIKERQASPNTIASYRDTFRLLLSFAQKRLKKKPSALLLSDLDSTFIGAFLEYLETEKNNSVRSRNARLAAIHSFFHYLALQEPAHSGLIQRVLAIPQKRFEKTIVRFLNRDEMEALLAAPDQTTWIGRRDHALLLLAVQTGLRVSELIGLKREDIVLSAGAHVRCHGKGRKERCTPLTHQVVTMLKKWLRECGGTPTDPLFPSTRGGHLSRDAVELLVDKHKTTASGKCSSFIGKNVSPHVLRHTTAVHLLQSGVDRSVIALWLGHEQVETTQIYLDADLKMKEKAIARTAPLPVRTTRYRPNDALMAFLQEL